MKYSNKEIIDRIEDAEKNKNELYHVRGKMSKEELIHALDHVLSDLDIDQGTTMDGVEVRVKDAIAQIKHIQKMIDNEYKN